MKNVKQILEELKQDIDRSKEYHNDLSMLESLIDTIETIVSEELADEDMLYSPNFNIEHEQRTKVYVNMVQQYWNSNILETIPQPRPQVVTIFVPNFKNQNIKLRQIILSDDWIADCYDADEKYGLWYTTIGQAIGILNSEYSIEI